MSHENVEIVRRCYGMWDNRDFSSIPEIAHPEFVLDVSRNVFNPGVHRGVDGFTRFVEQIDEIWENFDIEPEEFITRASTSSRPFGSPGRGAAAGPRPKYGCSTSGRCATARCCESRAGTEIAPRFSKPPGCGSRPSPSETPASSVG
jgi:hypothetical protein